MRVLICPDKFAGTLSALAAAEAMAAGWWAVRPDDEIRLMPLSDGGPGFVEVLHNALGGILHEVVVRGPLGAPVTATWLQVGDTAYLEAASANGVHLLAVEERDPLRASTFGVGQLIDAAQHVPRIVIGLGGSATNDGGRGAVEALGAREVPGLLVAVDVDAALLGPEGATYAFAAQKGATPAHLPVLEERIRQWAQQDLDMAETPGAGAAGGLGFGLMLLGGRVVPGIDVVMDAVGLPAACADVDVVLTGEGRFDAQSLRGKVVSGVLRHSDRVAVIAGRVDVTGTEIAVHSLVEEVGAERAVGDAAGAIMEVAARVAAGL